MSTVLPIVALALEALLGVFTLYAAYSLFTMTPPAMAKQRAALHYPGWYWKLAGVVATIGAIGLLVGLVVPSVGAAAAVWMVCYFIVATFTHLLRGDIASLGMPITFLVICAGLVALRWSDATSILAAAGLM